jgi:hypothetical protein
MFRLLLSSGNPGICIPHERDGTRRYPRSEAPVSLAVLQSRSTD